MLLRRLAGSLMAALTLLSCSSAPTVSDGAGGAPPLEDYEDVEHFSCRSRSEEAVVETTCLVYVSGVPDTAPIIEISIIMEGEGGVWGVSYEGLEPGQRLTPYAGSGDERDGAHSSPTEVTLGGRCFGGTSWRTPDPCTIELKAIEFEEGAGPEKLDTGEPILATRVRMAISCPDELLAPGSYDYGATPHALSPSEFEVEARNCEYYAR